MDIKGNYPLGELTTFKVGGAARYFCEAKNSVELIEALNWAKSRSIKIFVMAGGSNIIVADKGFDGLVVKPMIRGIKIEGTRAWCAAGETMAKLVEETINEGLAGLEWAGGLPGSVGGAVRGNAGAFGGEIKDNIVEVKSLDIDSAQEVTRSNKECQFGYRESIFKRVNEIITGASFEFTKGNKTKLWEIANSHIVYRQERHPMDLPNAGSVFKNVPLEKVPKEFLSLFEDAIKEDPFPIVPTAKIIAVAGLKGLSVGKAQVSHKHSNYIVNLGGAKAKDIVDLIQKIQGEVFKRFKITLEIEQQLIGFE